MSVLTDVCVAKVSGKGVDGYRELVRRFLPLLGEAADWLRIPSVSTGEGEASELERACEWVCERIDSI